MNNKISEYLTKDEKNFGCFLYIYSARWNLKYRSIHRYYTGLTTDIKRRWMEHRYGIKSGWKGKMNWMYHKKPLVSLDFVGIVQNRILFRIAEKYVQNLSKQQKLQLINSEYNLKNRVFNQK